MQSGLINKVTATAANITKIKGSRNICPNQGTTYADKGNLKMLTELLLQKRVYYLLVIKKRERSSY